MKNTLIIISLLILAVTLRLHNYEKYPQRGATSDEYAFAFSGVSLLTRGVPVGWSAIGLYKDRADLTIDGLYFPLVRPYLDHPPLFGLLVGAWAVAARETTFESIRLATIRVVPVVLSFLSAVLVYLLARHEFGEHIARWSLAIYATATIIVVNSRVVVAESLLTVIWLAALWMTTRLKKQSSKWDFFALGILCGAAILTKALGIVVWLSMTAVLLHKRVPLKRIAWVTVATIGGALAWYVYGRTYDETLFWAIQAYQGMTRVLGPKTIWMILGSPSIVNTIFYDGWYYWGLFAVGAASLNIRKNAMIVFPSFLYLLLLALSVNETDIHGWYLIPLFPFLAIAGVKLLVESIEKAQWTFSIWAMLIGASLIGPLWDVPFGLTPSVYRWLMGSILAASFIALRHKRVGYGVATLFVIGTAIATFRYVHPA